MNVPTKNNHRKSVNLFYTEKTSQKLKLIKFVEILETNSPIFCLKSEILFKTTELYV